MISAKHLDRLVAVFTGELARTADVRAAARAMAEAVDNVGLMRRVDIGRSAVDAVAAYYRLKYPTITAAQIAGPSRAPSVCEARQAAIIVLRRRDFGWTEIGQLLGGRGHPACIAAHKVGMLNGSVRRSAEDILDPEADVTDPKLRKIVDIVRQTGRAA